MSIIITGMKMPKYGECIVITSDGVASKYLAGDVAIYYDAHPDKASAIELPPNAEIMDYDSLNPDSEWSDYEDGYTAYSMNAIRSACIPAERE